MRSRSSMWVSRIQGAYLPVVLACAVGCSGDLPGAKRQLGGGEALDLPGALPEAIPGGTANPEGPATGPAPSPLSCSAGAALAPARVWALSDAQYTNIVRDVLGVSLTGVEAEITTAASTSGVYTNFSESIQVSTSQAQGYQRAAARVASRAQPCGGAVSAGCVDTFISDQVARLWRRPLENMELQELKSLYDRHAATDGPELALSLVVEAALQAPSFIYRTEFGQDARQAGTLAMTPYELAEMLGLLAFDSIPDEELWARASDGGLSQPSVFEAQVDRLLGLSTARAKLTQLTGYWAGTELIPGRSKSRDSFEEYTEPLRNSLHEASLAFLSDVIWAGTLRDLFVSSQVYVDDQIARVYGLPTPGQPGIHAVTLPSTLPKAGLLSQPGILSGTNKRPASPDPIHRGLFVYEAFICAGNLPAPPAAALEAAATMMGTERELAEQRSASASCAACHALFDPIGLTMHQFDPIGRYRPVSAEGAPVSSQAVLVGLGPELDGPVSGVEELAQRLATSRRPAACAARALSKFVLGYAGSATSCELAALEEQLAQGGSIRDYLLALLKAPGFRQRSNELN